MAKTGLLVITNPSRILRILPSIQHDFLNTLYIQYFPEKRWKNIFDNNNRQEKMSNTSQPSWLKYSSMVMGLYANTIPYHHLDIRVLLSGLKDSNKSIIPTKKPIEIVYFDKLLNNDQMQTFVSSFLQNKTTDCEVVALSQDIPTESTSYDSSNDIVKHNHIYNCVVIGGTFDRLHSGHKVMLSEAILRCQKKITVGVTDTPMLKSKKLWELIQPCDLRIQNVREFLEDIEPNLEYDIVPISDIYGPTKDDPTFEMIVVSSETVGGGSKINDVRASNGLNPLCVHSVELLADSKLDEVEEDKISSSNLRLRCLGTLLRSPQPRPNLPDKPYIIGLTGGITSGKTHIANYLRSLGAGIVNCDTVAHDLYQVGTTGYSQIVKEFGKAILGDDGVIDRSKLGNIVFNDEDSLTKLNNILWPLILQQSMRLAAQFYEEGHEVVVLDAAVMLKAGWQESCHEVWVSIVPPEEAIKRLGQRNGLNTEDAQKRLDAQLSNSDQVKHANVVFCSLWRHEYTQKQVRRAWEGLNERIKNRTFDFVNVAH